MSLHQTIPLLASGTVSALNLQLTGDRLFG